MTSVATDFDVITKTITWNGESILMNPKNDNKLKKKNVYVITLPTEDEVYIYQTRRILKAKTVNFLTNLVAKEVRLFAPIGASKSKIITFDTREEAEKQCEIFNNTLLEHSKKWGEQQFVTQVMEVEQII